MTKSRKTIHQLNTDVVGYWEGEALERGRRYSYRLEFLPLLLDYLGARAKMRILDVGCGTGFLARLMAQNLQNVQVVGLEGDGKLLSLGQEKLVMETLEDRVSFRQGDAYQLPFKDDAFDLVTSHTLLWILSDPAQGLREQIRVVQPGGTVSAIACFCHTDNLPNYHGRYPLPGNHHIDELSHKLLRVWRRHIRPGLLDVDHGIHNLDLLWEFKTAGLNNIQINGHLPLMSPGDSRIPEEEAAAHTLATHKANLDRFEQWRLNYGDKLNVSGFSHAEFEELIALKRARYEYLRENPARVREVMEVFVDPLIIIQGTRPSSSTEA